MRNSDLTENKGILNRYALVLDILAATPGGMTLTEITQASGLPRGTTHRLIGALRDVGYIEPINGRKVYVPGARLLRMLHLGTPDEGIARIVHPVLDELVGRYRETAFLAKLGGQQVRTVAMAVPSGENQSYVSPGLIMPVHATASAKVIFAYQDEAFANEILRQPREAFTPKTLVGIEQIRAELKRVQDLGYAICDEELDLGVFSYACPVEIEKIGVIYSVGLVGLTERLKQCPRNDIIADLNVAADRIASLLSGS
ncbi:MAG: IclR family transcriptional regulator [Gammaproteobacteria bacterium]|nr:IclR family transcriptional regulator [Gammaproteobacteria bacterium]